MVLSFFLYITIDKSARKCIESPSILIMCAAKSVHSLLQTTVRFKRVAAAFDDVAHARLCESSGSEHSPESSADLSDLVISFIEREGIVRGNNENETERDETETDNYWCDSKKKDLLQDLFGCRDDDDDHYEKQRIYAETESAYKLFSDHSSPEFKRLLVTHLRDRGFDAGLCKSRWEKTARFPAGSYEYVDVNIGKNRYILAVNLAAEFEIARPIGGYTSLLGVFPPIYVGKPVDLKQILRLMCAAAKESIKSVGMHMPPWRRNGHMQAKWFGSYKRTTNAVPAVMNTAKVNDDFKEKNRSVGFVSLPPVKPCRCRDVFGGKMGMKVGQLTAAFRGDDIKMGL